MNIKLCPACNNKSTVDKGALPAFPEQCFGGIQTSIKIQAGRFLWCPECDLHFRYPYPDQSVLNSLYQQLPSSVWECKEGRFVWKEVERLLWTYSANNAILDVGCFNGDFLSFLGGYWQKFGVELNIAACKIAAERGIVMVGDTIKNIQESVKAVGAILLLDVLEHIPRPLIALQNLKRFLAPEGVIIICTGATDTFAWRLFGRRYWYSALPEHVTFFSLRWFQWAASHLKMRVVWHRYFSSAPRGIYAGFLEFVRLFLYAYTENAMYWKSIPWWQAANDHLLIILA